MPKISYNILPCEDESLSSWLIRLSRKHYLSVQEFCSFFDLNKLFLQGMDIDTDLIQLQAVLGYNLFGIRTVKTIIHDFKWTKEQQQWLIHPNKKGSSLNNSYTQICPACITEKGYIQLKWKFTLFFGCSECGLKLINHCSKCHRPIFPLINESRIKVHEHYNPIHTCWNCRSDYREMRQEKLSEDEITQLQKLKRAYMEDPINARFLKFKQFGVIYGI